MSSPQHIWGQLRKGKQSALDALFRLYYSDMLRYGQQFFSEKSIVEDKIQEVFLRLWEKQKSLPVPNNILAFLIKSLRNALVDEKRKIQSKQNMISHLTWLKANNKDSEPALAIKRDQLYEALKQLSETQQEIIFLRFYNQLSYQEIAEIVEMKYQSVRNTVYRAMKVLRMVLENQSE